MVAITASADQSYSEIELRDLMLEVFAAYHVEVNLDVVEKLAVATAQAETESAKSIVAVAAVVLTVDPGLATKSQHSAGFVAAVGP